jgi:hypothetical protein
MKLDLSEDDISLLVYLLGFAGGSADRDSHPGLLENTVDLANRVIAQKEQARRDEAEAAAQPKKWRYPVVRPDLPRCSATSSGTGPGRKKGDPCRAPSTHPGGVCSAHFLLFYGHSVRYPSAEEGRGYCKLCGRRWDHGDRAVLKECCPKKPPVPPGDGKSWEGRDSWGPKDACRMPGPNCAGKVKAVDYDGINECDFLLCAFHAKEYRNL